MSNVKAKVVVGG